MHQLANQFAHALRLAWARRASVIFQFLAFMVITFILGTAFGTAFDKGHGTHATIGYVSEDRGPEGARYLDRLAALPGLQGVATFRRVESLDDGRRQVGDGGLTAVVRVPENFSAELGAGRTGTVDVLSEGSTGVDQTVVRAVVDAYNTRANARWVATSMGGGRGEPAARSSVTVRDVSGGAHLTSFGYYAVGMLLFFLLHGAEFGAVAVMREDILAATGRRARLSLVRPWQQLVGKLLAYSLVQLLIGLGFIGATALAFDVDWGNNLAITVAVVYVFGLLALSTGMAVMALTRDDTKGAALLQVVLLGMTFLAGGFIATSFGGLEKISPSYYARDALFSTMLQPDAAAAAGQLGIVLGVTVVLILTSVVLARRKSA